MTAALSTITAPAQLTPQWQRALAAFDADLRRRAVAAKTRRAYAIDTHQFGVWAGERRLAHVFHQAGFKHFRRATETPFNLVLEARK